jgi:hypothetical protein
MNNNVLIMTATVIPSKGMPGLIRVDPAVRLEDYRRALIHYLDLLGKGIDAIVFAENSNADLSVLHSTVAQSGHTGRVEFVVFDGTDQPPSHGRCSGEARILDQVMANSKVVASSADNCVFWKVTGRYMVKNLSLLVRRRPRRFDLYCDLRRSRTPWADMRFMAWTKPGYSQMLAGIAEDIREDAHGGRPGEVSLYHTLLRRIVGHNAVTSLTREPLIDGVRAFDERNWNQGRQKAVYHLRAIQRVLFGRVWI